MYCALTARNLVRCTDAVFLRNCPTTRFPSSPRFLSNSALSRSQTSFKRSLSANNSFHSRHVPRSRLQWLRPTFCSLLIRSFSADASGSVAASDSTISSNLRPTESSKPSMVILFGSQTGKAMGFAHELQKMAKRRKLPWKASVVDLAEFNPAEHLKSDALTVLVTACFGHGEPTDNAKQFFSWIHAKERELPSDQFGPSFFSGIHYTIFGLGQAKHYPERYQQVSKNFESRLNALGAHLVFRRGEGDDSNDIDGDFDEWSRQFFNDMEKMAEQKSENWKEMFQTSSTKPATQPDIASATDKQKAEVLKQAASGAASMNVASPVVCTPKTTVESPESKYNVKRPFSSRVLLTRELYAAESHRSCVNLRLALDSGMTYESGDYLGLFPRNSHAEVKAVAKRLKLDLLKTVDISSHPFLKSNAALLGVGADSRNSGQMSSPSVTVASVLSSIADLQGPPSRSVLRALAEYAKDPQEKDKLLFLSSSDTQLSKDEYTQFILNEKRTLLELLNCFHSIERVDSNDLLELIQPLRNRFYSICSSPLLLPNAVEIIASTVDFQTPTGRRHFGLSTRFLSERCEGDQVLIFVKQSLFRPPVDPATPMILFSAGTGVAPFKAFIDERMLAKREGKKVGSTILFFGCCHPQQDFLFADEFNAAVRAGVLTFVPAFSHAQPYRIFVQHRMIEQEHRKAIWKLMQEGGQIYVCGSAQRLAPAVHEALRMIVQQEGNVQDPLGYLKDLQGKGIYSLDIF